MRVCRMLSLLLCCGWSIIALNACLGQEQQPPTSTLPPLTQSGFTNDATGQQISIRETDTLKIEPGVLEARSGDITFVVQNAGSLNHTFVLEGNGIKYESAIIPGGQTVPLTGPGIKAGTYLVYCKLPGHKMANMSAQLTVR